MKRRFVVSLPFTTFLKNYYIGKVYIYGCSTMTCSGYDVYRNFWTANSSGSELLDLPQFLFPSVSGNELSGFSIFLRYSGVPRTAVLYMYFLSDVSIYKDELVSKRYRIAAGRDCNGVVVLPSRSRPKPDYCAGRALVCARKVLCRSVYTRNNCAAAHKTRKL